MAISFNCKFGLGFIFGATLLLAIFSTAQTPSDTKPKSQVHSDSVRIGIPVMGNTSLRTINRRLQRDSLVRSFQPDKKKKGKHPGMQRIEAIALGSASAEDAAREARDKNCDYILYTNLTELREPGDPQRPNQPGSVTLGRDPLAGYPNPQTVMHDPVHYAVVEYRLQRPDESQPRLSQSVSGEEHTDEDGTVQRLLFLIADRVKSELRQGFRTLPE